MICVFRNHRNCVSSSQSSCSCSCCYIGLCFCVLYIVLDCVFIFFVSYFDRCPCAWCWCCCCCYMGDIWTVQLGFMWLNEPQCSCHHFHRHHHQQQQHQHQHHRHHSSYQIHHLGQSTWAEFQNIFCHQVKDPRKLGDETTVTSSRVGGWPRWGGGGGGGGGGGDGLQTTTRRGEILSNLIPEQIWKWESGWFTLLKRNQDETSHTVTVTPFAISHLPWVVGSTQWAGEKTLKISLMAIKLNDDRRARQFLS